MIGLVVLIIFSFLLLGFGLFCLIISLGYPDWYKNKWQKDINSKIPQDLVTKTTIIGAVFTCTGFMLGLIILLVADSHATPQKYHHAKKKKSKKGIILLERKLKTGPSGGSYYTKRKCKGFGKSKKCKMIKIYAK